MSENDTFQLSREEAIQIVQSPGLLRLHWRERQDLGQPFLGCIWPGKQIEFKLFLGVLEIKMHAMTHDLTLIYRERETPSILTPLYSSIHQQCIKPAAKAVSDLLLYLEKL